MLKKVDLPCMFADAAAIILFNAASAVHPRSNESNIPATIASPQPTVFTMTSFGHLQATTFVVIRTTNQKIPPKRKKNKYIRICLEVSIYIYIYTYYINPRMYI